MPRGLTVDEKAECAKRVRSVAYLFELDLAAGVSRFWNGVGTLNTLSANWEGLGELLDIDGLESVAGLEAQSVSIGIAGIPTDYFSPGVIQATRAARYQGRPIVIYLALMNPDTNAPLFTPRVVWRGLMDTMPLSLGRTVSAMLTAEHLTSHLRRTNGLRMTTESHNQRLGNPATRDLFFEQQSRLLGRASPDL